MTTLVYTADDLRARLCAYEARYGISTEAVLTAYRAGSRPEGVPGFDTFEWAATSAELDRLQLQDECDALRRENKRLHNQIQRWGDMLEGKHR